VTSPAYQLKLLKRRKSITFPGAKKISERVSLPEEQIKSILRADYKVKYPSLANH
jgi:hypothetical protein